MQFSCNQIFFAFSYMHEKICPKELIVDISSVVYNQDSFQAPQETPYHLHGDVRRPVAPWRPGPNPGHVMERQALRGQLRQALPGCRAGQRGGVGGHGWRWRGAGVVAETWGGGDMWVQGMGAAGWACMHQMSLTQPGGNRSDSPRSGAALPNGYGVLGDGERTEMLRGAGGSTPVRRVSRGVARSGHY